VKTTAPKQYCVRPNSGRIDAGGSVEVQVLLQAMKEDPAPDAKCRDKFLVQSVGIAADKDTGNVGSLWSHIEQTNKSAIQERKIRVAFIAADATTPAKTNGIAHAQDTPSQQQRSPSPDAVTPHHTAISGLVNDTPSSEHTRSPTADSSAYTNATTTQTVTENVQAKAAQVQEKVSQAASSAVEQGEVRRRQGVNALENAGHPRAAQVLANPQANGVPLSWVFILVLLAFVIGWLVF